jgi:hypothetical protein
MHFFSFLLNVLVRWVFWMWLFLFSYFTFSRSYPTLLFCGLFVFVLRLLALNHWCVELSWTTNYTSVLTQNGVISKLSIHHYYEIYLSMLKLIRSAWQPNFWTYLYNVNFNRVIVGLGTEHLQPAVIWKYLWQFLICIFHFLYLMAAMLDM